jgi:hypothetical protein
MSGGLHLRRSALERDVSGESAAAVVILGRVRVDARAAAHWARRHRARSGVCEHDSAEALKIGAVVTVSVRRVRLAMSRKLSEPRGVRRRGTVIAAPHGRANATPQSLNRVLATRRTAIGENSPAGDNPDLNPLPHAIRSLTLGVGGKARRCEISGLATPTQRAGATATAPRAARRC